MITREDTKFYLSAIRDTVRDIVRIDTPVLRGSNSHIFIVETKDGARTVFRFNPRHVAHRNHDISHVLSSHDVPVPLVKLHLYQGQYFETYPYLAGYTFQECLNMGMSKSEILDTYDMMAQQIKKMTEIPVHNFKNIENKNCSSVAQSNIVRKTNSWLLGQGVKYGTKLLNAGDQNICHCDFTPQNVVFDAGKNTISVLDLNAVSVANINFALAITGLSLQHNKLNQHDFYRVCDDVLSGGINARRIDATERVCALYYRNYCK